MRLSPRNVSRPSASFRPRLEALEDRLLLSAGDLDPTFGIGGRAITDLGGTDSIQAMAQQADGKVVAVGCTNNGSNMDFGLVRYNSSGSLDTSFGAGGIVKTDIGNGSGDYAHDVAIQADGKIVVVGQTNTTSGGFDFAVVRYNANGSVDTSFGGNKAKGKVVVDFATSGKLGSTDTARRVALQSDGKIVVAGEGRLGFAMARLTTTGTLDTSFDGDGKVVTLFPGNNSARGYGLALQPDGKIIMAGQVNSLGLGLARYNPNGSLDTSFGTAGEVTLGSSGVTDSWYCAVGVQTNGKILVTGSEYVSTHYDAVLVRLNANGSLDTTFAAGGILVTALNSSGGDAELNSLAIQSDGKIVVGGTSGSATATARVNTDGTMDSTFGSGGIVTTDFGGGSLANWAVVLIQPDGKIVVGGGINGDFALERYLP